MRTDTNSRVKNPKPRKTSVKNERNAHLRAKSDIPPPKEEIEMTIMLMK